MGLTTHKQTHSKAFQGKTRTQCISKCTCNEMNNKWIRSTINMKNNLREKISILKYLNLNLPGGLFLNICVCVHVSLIHHDLCICIIQDSLWCSAMPYLTILFQSLQFYKSDQFNIDDSLFNSTLFSFPLDKFMGTSHKNGCSFDLSLVFQSTSQSHLCSYTACS